jgi:hypothetical protein
MSLKSLKKQSSEQSAPSVEDTQNQILLAEERQRSAKIEAENAQLKRDKEAAEAATLLARTTGAIKDSAVKLGAISPDEAATLVMAAHGSKIAPTETGEFKIADKSIDEFMGEFLKSRPHLKAATPVAQGSGQTAGVIPTNHAQPRANPTIKLENVRSNSDYANAINEALKSVNG